MPAATIYSGNKAGWLMTVANLIQDGGDKPPSLEGLLARVPDRVGTARNDGHVTAAENGYARRDYRKGYDIWVRGAVAALREAGLTDDDDDALHWIGPVDGSWKVPFGGNVITIYGKAERAQSRVQSNFQFGVASGYADITVKVETHAKGKVFFNERTLTAHPLALMIPPMTEDEQRAMREDIEKNGVEVPILLFADENERTARGKPVEKILDGRHRAFFASLADKPVQVERFEGTVDEARDRVVSLNLRRRHLTPQQLALSVARLFGEEAKTEAKEASREGHAAGARKANVARHSPGDSTATGNGRKRGKEAHQRAYEKAGKPPGITADTVKAMMALLNPKPDDSDEVKAALQQIAADVDSGKIKSTSDVTHKIKMARKKAAGEPVATGRKGTVGQNITSPRSAFRRMGEAVGQLEVVRQEWESETEATKRIERSPAQWAEMLARAERIVELATWLRGEIGKGAGPGY
jgi:hypothetical protein